MSLKHIFFGLFRVTSNRRSAKNNRGFGILEVMIVTVAVTAIIFAIATLLDNSLNQFKRASIKTAVNDLKIQVESVIQRNAACIHNLKIENSISFGGTPNYSLTKLMQENSATTFTSSLIPALGVPTSAGSRLMVSLMTLTNTGTNNPPTPVLVTAATKLFLTGYKGNNSND